MAISPTHQGVPQPEIPADKNRHRETDIPKERSAVVTETETEVLSTEPTESSERSKLIEQYGCGPVQLAGRANALYERHLVFDNVMDMSAIGAHQRFEAVARSVRDILSQRWIQTEKTYDWK